MTQQQAERLYALMARPEWSALIEYQRDLLAQIHENLEWADDRAVHVLQGRALEIKRFLGLQKQVNEFLTSQ